MIPKEHLEAIRTGAAWAGRPDLYTLRVAGPDRVRFLNGMVTTDVAALEPGRAQRAIKPSNRGRIEGLVRVRTEADAFLIDVVEAVAQTVASQLVQFIIMDDCTLTDATPEREVCLVAGPDARQVIEAAGWPGGPEDDLTVSTPRPGTTLIRDDGWFGVPTYELHVPAGELDATRSRLEEAGAIGPADDAFEVVRVESGIPRDGVDLDADTIRSRPTFSTASASRKVVTSVRRSSRGPTTSGA